MTYEAMGDAGTWFRRLFQPGYSAAEGIAALYRGYQASDQMTLSPEAIAYQKQQIASAVASGMTETGAAQEIAAGRMPGQRGCVAATPASADSLTDEYSRAIHIVQTRLCALGFDPGPITGWLNAYSRVTFDNTIRRFQVNVGICRSLPGGGFDCAGANPGEPDRRTLLALGIPATDVDRMAGILASRGRTPSPTGGGGDFLAYGPLVAFVAAGGLLAFAGWRYVQKKKG